MASYEHAQIMREMEALGAIPTGNEEYSSWIRAMGHLQLMKENAEQSEVIIYASSKTVFIHAELAKKFKVSLSDTVHLLDWYSTPFMGRAAFCWTSGTRDVEIDFTSDSPLPRNLKERQNLVFGRRIEGMDEPYYYELLQEFAHATDIHWREELQAYCRLDENGDVDPVVSISASDENGRITLITCKREPLEQYLAATERILVRFFDFMMVQREKFSSWAGAVTERNIESPLLAYEQHVHPQGHGWTRGAQLLPVTTGRKALFGSIVDPGPGRRDRQYASFIAFDWRNNKVEEISTDPESSTNYFVAESNMLPFELSPAFFRPEVLSKYKADRNKYALNEEIRFITCRGAWDLRSYDINEAGQVHAYIYDLRYLPYQEQLYWKSFNEEPKGSISKRAFENDFKGTWASQITGLERILHILRKWLEQKADWWKLPDQSYLLQVNTPISTSKDEWGQAFLSLSKAVIEGFQETPIKSILKRDHIAYCEDDKTLMLLEKLVTARGITDEPFSRLNGLRTARRIRSKVQSHLQGTEAHKLARNALLEHGTYRKHFEHICNQIADEIELIDKILDTSTEDKTQ